MDWDQEEYQGGTTHLATYYTRSNFGFRREILLEEIPSMKTLGWYGLGTLP